MYFHKFKSYFRSKWQWMEKQINVTKNQMTGILQVNLAAVRLFSVVEHSPPYLKQHILKLCLPKV